MKRLIETKKTRAATLGLAALAAAMTAQTARAGSCIVSGDPATVATAGSSSCATAGTALVTWTLSASVASPSPYFNIRDWTLFETDGIRLNTRPWQGGLFIVR